MASAQLLACVHDEDVTYVATSNVQDLVPPNDIGDDPSPLLTPEPLFDHQDEETTNHHINPISVVVHNSQQVNALLITLLLSHNHLVTERCYKYYADLIIFIKSATTATTTTTTATSNWTNSPLLAPCRLRNAP